MNIEQKHLYNLGVCENKIDNYWKSFAYEWSYCSSTNENKKSLLTIFGTVFTDVGFNVYSGVDDT